jgi:hypothetical protein
MQDWCEQVFRKHGEAGSKMDPEIHKKPPRQRKK